MVSIDAKALRALAGGKWFSGKDARRGKGRGMKGKSAKGDGSNGGNHKGKGNGTNHGRSLAKGNGVAKADMRPLVGHVERKGITHGSVGMVRRLKGKPTKPVRLTLFCHHI